MPDLLFELICEELPPRDVARATAALEAELAAALTAADLAPGRTAHAYTPRRMTVWAFDVPERSPDRAEELSGPPENVAFSPDGTPTKAGEGFARKAGVSPSELERRDGRVYAVARTAGRAAADALAEILPALPARVPWRKTMRWNAPVAFARPIRGVVALLGAEVVACVVAGVPAGRATRGHTFLTTEPIVLASADPDAHREALRAGFVLADPGERRATVAAKVRAAAPTADVQDDLLDEVTNLVEWPSALVGNFDARYLLLPARLLTTAMGHHQRFFPVRDAVGVLEPRFVAVLDRTDASLDVCRPGFERVLVPRLHDASFFHAEDRKRPLADRLSQLEHVLYHRKLGTLRDKAARLERLAGQMARRLGADDATIARAARAGLLAKCDLVTHQVGEFPELQGYVGSVYAAADGEPADVCAGIDNQYRHRFEAGEDLPTAAVAVCLAEHLDTLCQFGTHVGLPKGNTDPFGVRRSAQSVLEVSDRFCPELELSGAVADAGGDADVLAYLRKRMLQRLRDEGALPDQLDAAEGAPSIGALRRTLGDLDVLASRASFARLLEVAERCRNITRKADVPPDAPLVIERDLLTEPAERTLADAWDAARAALPAPGEPLRADHVARLADALAEPLHTFFAEVFVNAEDERVRANRLALLLSVDRALLRFADLCRIAKR